MQHVNEIAFKHRWDRAGRPVKAFDHTHIEFLPSPGEWGYVATLCSGPDGGWLEEGFFLKQFPMLRDAVAAVPGMPLSEWEEVVMEGLSRECGVRFLAEAEVADYMATEGVRWRGLFHFGHPRASAWYETVDDPKRRRRLQRDAWKARTLHRMFGTPSKVNIDRPGRR